MGSYLRMMRGAKPIMGKTGKCTMKKYYTAGGQKIMKVKQNTNDQSRKSDVKI